MIDKQLLMKYGGQTGVLLAILLGAAECRSKHSLNVLGLMTGLTPKQVGVRFGEIRKMGFMIRKRYVAKQWEYWIERPQSTNKTKGAR